MAEFKKPAEKPAEKPARSAEKPAARSAEKAAPKAKSAPESGHDPETMAHPEQDATGMPRHRVEDGPELPEGKVTLIPPERGPAE